MFLMSDLATGFFVPIVILLALASLSSIMISALKLKFLPAFTIEIIIGLIISRLFNKCMGSSGLETVVPGIYTLSLAMIMFMSGYDVDFDIFKDVRAEDAKRGAGRHLNIFKTALIVSALTYLAATVAAVFVNYYAGNNKLLGIVVLAFVFASTFAAMVVPILHDGNAHRTVVGKVIATIANISEIVSIGFLTVLMIALEVKKQYAAIFLLFALILVLWRVLRKYKIGRVFDRVTAGIDFLSTRVIIVLLLFLVFLSDLAGGEYILGAFFAGMFVRHTQFPKKAVEGLSGIIFGVFAPMFFIIVGTRIDILSFVGESANIWLVVMLFLAYAAAELPVFFLLKWYKINTVIAAMALISCTVIVPIAAAHIGIAHDLFSPAFSEALILAGLLVCITGTILFKLMFPFNKYKNECEECDNEKNN